MKLMLTIKEGPDTIAEVKGIIIVDLAEYRLADIAELLQCERTLEHSFGLRFHISEMQ